MAGGFKERVIGILPVRGAEAVRFAARELRRYLEVMAGAEGVAVIGTDAAGSDAGLRLGLFEDFGIDAPEVEDPHWDDAIRVRVEASAGVIAGSNPRSVLFAVYRFLEANGCRWVRPGKDGDFVPACGIGDLNADLAERPECRYRGHSNCGGSVDSIVEKIEWMPKVGLNVYYEEFFPPSRRSRHYDRKYPTLLPPQRLSDIEVAAFGDKEMREVKKRGLIFQAVGHGWTAAFYGLYAVESDADKAEFCRRAEAEPRFLAEVNGERRPHRRGGALYTELCYGNPEVRERLAERVADYAGAHPEIEIIQFGMSDAMNLMCECPLCRDTAPSDLLIRMLNGIDQTLTARQLPTRIGFALYQETWWPPREQHIENPERFVMKFCPIGRDYRQPYATDAAADELPGFVYNRNERIADIRGVTASLRAWQKHFDGDAFAFEYHLTWYHYFDPGQFMVASILADDIRRLPALGLRGFVSCQVVRCHFPVAFALTAHAHLLWDASLTVDHLAAEYFEGAFGPDGPACADYFRRLSELFVPGAFYRYVPPIEFPPDSAAAQSLAQVAAVVDAFKPVIERNLGAVNPVHARSWRYTHLHAALVRLLADCLRAKAEGNQTAVDAYWDRVLDFILINENRLASAFDTLWFYEAFLRRTNLFSASFRSTGGFETRDVLNVSARLQDPRD